MCCRRPTGGHGAFEQKRRGDGRERVQEAEGRQKRDALSTQASGFERRERDLQQQLADLGAGLESLRQLRDNANAALTETKVAQVIELARRHQHPLQCTMEKE